MSSIEALSACALPLCSVSAVAQPKWRDLARSAVVSTHVACANDTHTACTNGGVEAIAGYEIMLADGSVEVRHD
jgi:hypothetical protein